MKNILMFNWQRLADAPPKGNNWLHEIKFDGYRLLAFVSQGEVRLRTRNGNDWTRKFPSIQAQLACLKVESAVLDMEAVVLDAAEEQLPGSTACVGRRRKPHRFRRLSSICFISTAGN